MSYPYPYLYAQELPPPRWPDPRVFGPPLGDDDVRRIWTDRGLTCTWCGTRGADDRCWYCGRLRGN